MFARFRSFDSSVLLIGSDGHCRWTIPPVSAHSIQVLRNLRIRKRLIRTVLRSLPACLLPPFVGARSSVLVATEVSCRLPAPTLSWRVTCQSTPGHDVCFEHRRAVIIIAFRLHHAWVATEGRGRWWHLHAWSELSGHRLIVRIVRDVHRIATETARNDGI